MKMKMSTKPSVYSHTVLRRALDMERSEHPWIWAVSISRPQESGLFQCILHICCRQWWHINTDLTQDHILTNTAVEGGCLSLVSSVSYSLVWLKAFVLMLCHQCAGKWADDCSVAAPVAGGAIRHYTLTSSGTNVELHSGIFKIRWFKGYKISAHRHTHYTQKHRFMKIYLYLDAKTHNLKQYCSRGEEYCLLVGCMSDCLARPSSSYRSPLEDQLSTENKQS